MNGYWDPLLTLLDHIVAQGFAEQSFVDSLQVVSDVPELVIALREAFS